VGSQTTPVTGEAPAAEPSAPVDCPARARRRATRWRVVAAVALLALIAGAVPAIKYFKTATLAHSVRRLYAARRYHEGREPLARWLALKPNSGEALYYKAWEALVFDQPGIALEAIHRSRAIGFDPERLHALSAIGQARGNQSNEAEPFLEHAFSDRLEPKDMIAKELARIYLSSYRLDQAAEAIARWRELAPDDPQPYMWSNEIASRSEASPAILIQNYRAALARDPSLDQARIGLARELSAARRFDEANAEFHDYLSRQPGDTTALLGLGKNAFQQGDIQEAKRQFEKALAVSPREPGALMELGQIELRLGKIEQACAHLRQFIEIDPYDYQSRYLLAAAFRQAGSSPRANSESAAAERLRLDHRQMLQFRYDLSRDPRDLNARFRIARWLLLHGKVDEGIKWTKEILRAEPGHALTHGLLADYYAKQPGSEGLANYHRALASAGSDGAAATGTRAPAPTP
jgi:tetratricopeptide (TPR) repeat protein